MPLYAVQYDDGTTDEVFDSYDNVKQRERDGEFKLMVAAPLIVSGVGTVLGTVDSGFNDVLQKIKSHHRHSTIVTK